MRVGGQVAEANLIRKVQPVYPPLAKSARVSGTVEFTATISKEGNIENLQLVRGHPLLVNAAKEAVLQWKYQTDHVKWPASRSYYQHHRELHVEPVSWSSLLSKVRFKF